MNVIFLIIVFLLSLWEIFQIHTKSHCVSRYRAIHHPIHKPPSPHTPSPSPHTPSPSPHTPSPSHPHRPPVDHHSSFVDAILTPTNESRKAHCVSPMSWDSKLAQSAQIWANHQKKYNECAMKHSGTPGVGENVFWMNTEGQIPSTKFLGEQAVKSWVGEESSYNYNRPGFSEKTGHFTQVVWKDSDKVGCAVSQCGNDDSNASFVVCQYLPPGNVMGEFKQNVLNSSTCK